MQTVTLELDNGTFRRSVDLTTPVLTTALDDAETLCLGKYSNKQLPGSGKFGSFDCEISNIQKDKFDLSTNENDIETVIKAYGKYAANCTALGKYEQKDRLFPKYGK